MGTHARLGAGGQRCPYLMMPAELVELVISRALDMIEHEHWQSSKASVHEHGHTRASGTSTAGLSCTEPTWSTWLARRGRILEAREHEDVPAH
jgi:hypothetical protein